MIHPAFVTLAKQPGLFFEHAQAYADLASAEASEWGQRCRQRATLSVSALVALTLGVALACVAGLLCAAIPVHSMPHPWLLWALPALPLLVAVGLWIRLRRLDRPDAFESLRQQVAQDLATLKLLDPQ